ncbi:MAG: 1-phosphofructokinase family hexose kinase [Anaerolineae bacterium]|nr:1-phosphofructokinase family hexose kinase [Anaerolineae bacterium]
MNNSRIITLTLNPAIDLSFAVDALTVYDKNLVDESSTFLGGKGINVAFALGKLGDACLASGFIGRRELVSYRRKLAAVSVEADFVPVNGRTRVNYKVMDRSVNKDTEFNQPGFTVSPAAVARLARSLSAQMPAAAWLALSGSLPLGAPVSIYADLIRLAGQSGVKTCLDASGPALVAGLAARPALLRVNRAELEQALGRDLNDQGTLAAGMRELIASGVEMAVISLGKDGVIGSDGRQTWLARVPAVKPLSLTGAGDTLTAGCLHCLTRGMAFSEMLRFGSALATASILKAEPGDFDPGDFSGIFEKTTLRQL